MLKTIIFTKKAWKSRFLIWELTKRNVTQRYRKSKLGMIWSLVEPLSFMGILYLVFGIGLRESRTMEMPFVCYLISGMSVVQLFTVTLNSGTESIRSHAFLLKKVNFRIAMLPLSTVLTGIINHLIFLCAAIVVFISNKIYPSFYWIQTFYYLFALSLLLLGITWFTSSVGVFLPDLQHLVSVVGRLTFYMTPVFWSFDMLSEKMQAILKINPLYYIVMGYRESLYYKIGFWKHPNLTIYFWIWIVAMLALGTYTFNRLKSQFTDYI